MDAKANEELKQLCELAANEQDHGKLMLLAGEIIALLDANQGKSSASPEPKLNSASLSREGAP
jgi:hypothetical protein